MTKRTCSIDGCEKDFLARGWCSAHYARWSRTGDPLGHSVRTYNREDVLLRLARRSKLDLSSGCWLWQGNRYKNGYGQIWDDGKGDRVHRVAYRRLVGPIPRGLVLDHVRARGCVHKNCWNPSHLEAVTNRTNVLRSDIVAINKARIRTPKTHCPHGHPYDSVNTCFDSQGYRRCKTCLRVSRRRSAGLDVEPEFVSFKVVAK